jgi:transcriptional regulator
MAGTKAELLQGTLAMLILKSLAAGDLHGYSIARWIETVTKEALAIGEGSLYPTLRRLEDKQLVKSAWKMSDTGRRVRVYSLTRAGRAHLKSEASGWLELTRAITLVLQAEPSIV